MVRERRALGEPGRTRRVLDVDRVVAGQRRRAGIEVGSGRAGRAGHQVGPARIVEIGDGTQRGALAGDGLDHLPVVAALVTQRRHQHGYPGLAEHEPDLVPPVRRVDVDHDGADHGGRVLNQHPLRPVRCPDAHPVALVDTDREQRPGELVDVGGQLTVGPPATAGHVDQGLAIREAGGGAGQVLPDGVGQQLRVGRSTGVREFTGHGRLRVAIPNRHGTYSTRGPLLPLTPRSNVTGIFGASSASRACASACCSIRRRTSATRASAVRLTLTPRRGWIGSP